MRVAIILLVVAGLLTGAALAAASDDRKRAFVAVAGSNELAVVDLGRGRVSARLAVATGPRAVATTADGRVIVVASAPAGKVTLVDGRTLEVVHVFGGFGRPVDVALAPDGRYAFVADQQRSEIVSLDLGKRQVAARVRLAARPQRLVVGDRIWVTHGSGARAVTVLAGTASGRPRVVKQLSVDGPARGIARAPDTANLYITYWASPLVAGIDAATGRTIFRARVGAAAKELVFDYFSGRDLWMTARARKSVARVSARTGRVIHRYGRCDGAEGLSLAGGQWRLAVACAQTGRLWLLRDGGRISTVEIGGHPRDVAVTASGG